MPQRPAADEPFAIAVRSQKRLARAMERIGIAAGPGVLRLYADIDPLGTPVVVMGPIGAALADRLSWALERGPLHAPESDLTCP